MTIASRFFQLASGALDRFGVMADQPAANAIIRHAETRWGLEADGEWPVREALEVWADSLRREAGLNGMGRLMARADALRLLANLAAVQAADAADPSVAEEPIVEPVFIMGMPRSGTTSLHRLLSLDPANQIPCCWQVMHPFVRGRRDRRRAQAEQELRLFLQMVPALTPLHPLGADLPQECTEISAHVFRSLRFDTTYRVPSYRAWLDRSGHRDAYRFHRRFLQHFQRLTAPGWPGTVHWVLKSPDHVFALADLRHIYPDARIVLVHRDPLKVLPSVAKLTEVLRAPCTGWLSRAEIGAQIAADWLRGANVMVETAAADRLKVINLHYRDLVQKPLETIERLYGLLGRHLSDETRERMRQFAATRPRGGYGVNHYRFADHAIDPVRERRRFAPYMSAFAIEPEVIDATG